MPGCCTSPPSPFSFATTLAAGAFFTCVSVHQGLFYERSVFLYLIADMQQQVLVQMVCCFFLVEEMLTAWYEP
jgi:hypothetical protein